MHVILKIEIEIYKTKYKSDEDTWQDSPVKRKPRLREDIIRFIFLRNGIKSTKFPERLWDSRRNRGIQYLNNNADFISG